MATMETNLAENSRKATFAIGCFWGEYHFRKHLCDKGLLDSRVGYCGGHVENPSYAEVSDEKTGHFETIQVMYDPERISYRDLVVFFYRIHGPTTLARQGPSVGPQYRSAIVYNDLDQERIAREVTAAANKQWWGQSVVTEILPVGNWWKAEDEHQRHLERSPNDYRCPTHTVRDFPALVLDSE